MERSPEFLSGSATLENPGWLEWNEATWGVSAHPFSITSGGNDLPRLTGVIYKDRRGRAVLPPLNPHIPLQLETTPTRKGWRLTSQWLELAGSLAEEFAAAGIVRPVALPPGLLDARPFQQAGIKTLIRYTYIINFPHSIAAAHSSVRKRVKKAQRLGYRVERSDDWRAVVHCLQATEDAKAFSYLLSTQSLIDAEKRMGSDYFRAYLVRSGKGEPVSAGIRLTSPGNVAIDWVQGAKRSHLQQGVNQLIYAFVLADLEASSARGLDFAGADIQEVALAKSYWGGTLTPQLGLQNPGLMNEARLQARTILKEQRILHRVHTKVMRRQIVSRSRESD